MSQATVTAKVGPATQNTAIVYTNVSSFKFDTARRVLTLVRDSITTDFDLSAATTVTCSVTGANFSFTIS